MRKILVLRGGALGDFIVTLPALTLLRERWLEARIELAGNAVAGRLALARGLIDAVHSQHEARWAGLFGDTGLSGEFAEWLDGFDLVINFWPDADGALGRHFPRHARQRFLSAPAMPARTPAAAHYCEPLRAIGIEAREYFYRLSPLYERVDDREVLPLADPLAHARSYERKIPRFEHPLAHPRSYDERGIIAIHPGSGSPRKNWPMDNWRRLIEELPRPVSLILGEAEQNAFDVGPALAAAPKRASNAGIGAAPINLKGADERQPYLLQNRPLEELVDHFAGARLFLGHDSGISHLAAACGVRCVLLFGPTEPAMWAPPAPNVRVLRSLPTLATLPFEALRRAVEEELADRT